MKINRAVGLLLFLVLANIILRDIFSAFSRTAVATLHTVEIASEVMSSKIQEMK